MADPIRPGDEFACKQYRARVVALGTSSGGVPVATLERRERGRPVRWLISTKFLLSPRCGWKAVPRG